MQVTCLSAAIIGLASYNNSSVHTGELIRDLLHSEWLDATIGVFSLIKYGLNSCRMGGRFLKNQCGAQ
jgi:hypothetical protein